VDFLRLWSVIIPASLTIIILGMVISDYLIIRETRDLESSAMSRLSSEDQTAALALETQAKKFNADIGLVQGMRKSENFKLPLMQDVLARAESSSIVISSVRFQGNTFTVGGSATTEDKIIGFKNVLQSSGYLNVDLPLSAIRKDPQGYIFSMTFSRTPTNTP
jgi:hypothetical protein